MSKQVEALKKELTRVRSKNRLLEASLNLGCRVWIDVDLKNHPYPQGLPIAICYRALGTGDKFIVLGWAVDAIEKMAQVYAKERFGEKAIDPRRLDQSKIGLVFKESGLAWEVISPALYESDWLVVEASSGRRRYLSNAELKSKFDTYAN